MDLHEFSPARPSRRPVIRSAGILAVGIFLVIATLAVYWPVRHYSFINYDDQEYVFDNPDVQAGLSITGITWAFTTTHFANWHPLTWISHMLDVQLFGMDPGMHHQTSLLLHVFNALLLFHVFRRMTGALWHSGFLAALFALHPLHVESVAWVSERKDVLSTLFWMLTMWAYIRYVERPGFLKYLQVLLFFMLGLMAKPMLVTLPFVLLAIDYWPLKRLSGSTSALRLLWEKAPLLIFSALSSLATVFAQHGMSAIKSLETYPFEIRIENAIVAYAAYMAKMIWPQNLAAFYPHPEASLSLWLVLGAAALMSVISVLVLRTARRYPFLIVGWLWYLGTLVPVIGLVQVGFQAMADRYTYVPLIGLFLMATWGAPLFFEKLRCRSILLFFVASLFLGMFMIGARHHVYNWKDDTALFGNMIQVTDRNFQGHNGMGLALAGQGLVDQAIVHYETAIRIKPDFDRALNNLGIALLNKGSVWEAVDRFEKALQVDQNNATYHNNLGVALMAAGRAEQAVSHFRQAVTLEPSYVQAQRNLANARTELEPGTNAVKSPVSPPPQ
ncbi:MAG: tetratricopeptide repeat protein [Thermodesulfobacteriota bacterium]